MTSISCHERRPSNADFSLGAGKNNQEPGQEIYGISSSVVTLVFANKSLPKGPVC